MKAIKTLILVLLCSLCTACIDGDWDNPLNGNNSPVGNNAIKETNVISIKEFKEKYADIIENSGCKLIDEDIQIKGIVTGNDMESNIYQQLFIEDESGEAMCIAVTTSSISKDLGIGQQILVSLKDLYIGAYRKQPQVGALYNGGIGRMTYNTWREHFKAIGRIDASKVQPAELDANAYLSMTTAERNAWLKQNCGRLMRITNVSIDQSGTKVFAPEDGSVYLTSNCANRSINGKSALVLRTSIYSDFHNNPLPETNVNITGIFTRYDATCQILMRKASDVEEAQ